MVGKAQWSREITRKQKTNNGGTSLTYSFSPFYPSKPVIVLPVLRADLFSLVSLPVDALTNK